MPVNKPFYILDIEHHHPRVCIEPRLVLLTAVEPLNR